MEKRVYFKNLNALRFIAAVAVIFHHVEQYKFWAKLPNIWGDNSLDALGSKAVSFFFVLSGFLITYLLLEEKRKTSDIRIREFYFRRILRIWPVYFIVVTLCLFVVPRFFDLSFLNIDLYNSQFILKVFLLFLVLPNVVRVFSPNIAGGNQLWSIGVEEQFYLIWPVVVRFFYHNLIGFLVFFIAAKFAITVGLQYAVAAQGGKMLDGLLRFWSHFKMEQMAVGAIGSWVLFTNRKTLLVYVYHPVTQIVTWILFGLLFILPVHHWSITFFEAFIFVSIILNLSTNPAVGISMESALMNTLGNISYGIYMYHTLCITACLYALDYFGLPAERPVFFNVLLYTGSVVLTITVAYLSYEFIEKRFLKLKEHFAVVKSGRGGETASVVKTET